VTKWNKCRGGAITISDGPDYRLNCAAAAEKRGITRGKQRVVPEVGKPKA
jgi:hypothetical protein